MGCLMVKEDNLDGEGILIIFYGETRRKEIKFVNSSVLEGKLALFKDPLVGNNHQNKEMAYSNEL